MQHRVSVLITAELLTNWDKMLIWLKLIIRTENL